LPQWHRRVSQKVNRYLLGVDMGPPDRVSNITSVVLSDEPDGVRIFTHTRDKNPFEYLTKPSKPAKFVTKFASPEYSSQNLFVDD